MRVLSLAEAEAGPQVLPEDLALGRLLDGLEDLLVERGLVGLPLVGGLVGLLLGLEDVALLLGLLLGGPHPAEVLVVELLGHLDAGDVDGGGGGQQVALVDPAQGAAVDLEGAWKQSKEQVD